MTAAEYPPCRVVRITSRPITVLRVAERPKHTIIVTPGIVRAQGKPRTFTCPVRDIECEDAGRCMHPGWCDPEKEAA